MRWVASLVALGLMMALFHHVTAASPLEARAALALGFLLVAAWLGGELARRARLPRITGFLVLGLCLGPAWLNLVHADEVGALGFVADACVALIAFTAGSAVPLAALRTEDAALSRLAAATIVVPLAVVTLVTLSVSARFPLTVHQPFGNAAAVALTLGVIAAASSSVVTVAVLEEERARGPFARTVLGVTVVKDLAVGALLCVVVVASRLWASPGAVRLGAAGGALTRWAGALAMGAAAGALAAQYLKLGRREAVLVLIGLAFVCALAARGLHVEGALVALAAGVYLGTVAPEEATRLRAELARAAGPVYAIAFTVAGAGFRLETLGLLWPWVLLLVGLRIVALRYGALWAGRSPALTPAHARAAWLGLISQSGTALGLAAAARQAFPAWGVSLENLVVALVAVQEVIGPVGLHHALVRVGELGGTPLVGAGAGSAPLPAGPAGGAQLGLPRLDVLRIR